MCRDRECTNIIGVTKLHLPKPREHVLVSLCGGQLLPFCEEDTMILQRVEEEVCNFLLLKWWQQNLLASFPGLPTMWSGYEARYNNAF